MRVQVGRYAPSVHTTAVVAPSATLSGNVSIGPHSLVAHGACLIADEGSISIGEGVVLRENVVVRSTRTQTVKIASNCLIGAHASLYGCRIDSEVFVATGASIFHGSIVESNCEIRIHSVVHVNTRVPSGTTVPVGWIAVGDPAQLFAPVEHEKIWEIQRTLDFPKTAYDLDRDEHHQVDMRKLTGKLVAEAQHRSVQIIRP